MPNVRRMSTAQVSSSALGGRRAWSRDPGRAIPAALWAAAVEVADTEVLSTTARAMGVDRQRLSRQLGDRSAMAVTESSTSFVELDACSVFEQGRALVRLTLRDGAHLEVVLDHGCRHVPGGAVMMARPLVASLASAVARAARSE